MSVFDCPKCGECIGLFGRLWHKCDDNTEDEKLESEAKVERRVAAYYCDDIAAITDVANKALELLHGMEVTSDKAVLCGELNQAVKTVQRIQGKPITGLFKEEANDHLHTADL